MNRDQLDQIVGDGAGWLSMTPHLVAEFDERFIDVVEGVSGTCVALFNYPAELLEDAEAERLPGGADYWESPRGRSRLRQLIQFRSMSLYGRHVILAGSRCRPGDVARLLDAEGQRVPEYWRAAKETVDTLGWLAVPELPNSDVAVLCVAQERRSILTRFEAEYAKEGKECWYVSP
jgi:hypothetical protein